MLLSNLKKTASKVKNGVGVLINNDIACALRLTRNGSSFRIKQGIMINRQTDGLLNQHELAGALTNWAEDKRLARFHACMALPVLGTTELVSLLPVSRNDDELQNMVRLQLKALGSLSDDSFLYDHQPLGEQHGEHTPVLMCIAREETIENQFQLLDSSVFDIRMMTSNSLAVVNSFAVLQPEAFCDDSAQIILDVEAEATAMAIVTSQQLQQICWLPSGFQQILASQMPHAVNTMNDGLEFFRNDVLNALGRWREALPEDKKDISVKTIWLTGIGAIHSALAESLKKHFPALEVRILGIPNAMLSDQSFVNAAETHPELTVPFGLALQALRQTPVTVSLLPERVKWQLQKRSQFPYLVAAAACLIFVMGVTLYGIEHHLKIKQEQLSKLDDELTACLSLSPKVNKAREELMYYQRQMLPIIEARYRTSRYLEAINLWQQAQTAAPEGKQCWGIYLADESSFARANSNEQKLSTNQSLQPPDDILLQEPKESVAAPLPFMSDSPIPKPALDTAKTYKTHTIPVNEIKILKELYIGGIAPAGEAIYKSTKDIQANLQQSNAYANVDDHTDYLSAHFKERISQPWEKFLEDNKDTIGKKYMFYFLRLPFQEDYVSEQTLGRSTAGNFTGNY